MGKPRAGHTAVELVRGTAPSWLGGDAVHALTSSFLAALVIAAALLRSDLQALPFDSIALLLRSASVAFALRALLAIVHWARRLARDARAGEHVLAWSSDGLWWRSPEAEQWLARAEVADLRVPEERSVRGASSSLAPLLVIARPGQTLRYWSLPPYFAVDAEVLLARLKRWHEPAPTRLGELTLTPPREGPDARYARAARRKLEPGELPVPEGFGYRLRAPYGVLLALVFVGDALFHAGELRTRLWPAAVLAAVLAPGALGVWFGWLRSRRAVRLGMAMLLTPEELLLRGKQGVVSVPWTQLAEAEVEVRLAWSLWVGSYLVRTLWFSTLEGTRMPFDAGFLGVPPEVIASLANGYRSGAFTTPASSETPASTSQGSGGGGGISGSAGETRSPSSSGAPSLSNEKPSASAGVERTNES